MKRLQYSVLAFAIACIPGTAMSEEKLLASPDRYTIQGYPYEVVTADLDGDTYPDVAAVNSVKVAILLNDGGGSLESPVYYDAGDAPQHICAGDIDGDGDRDLVVMNQNDHDFSILPNNGDGTFGDPIESGSSTIPRNFALSDLDGDGDIDLAVAGSTLSGNVDIRLNNGEGAFEGGERYDVGSHPMSIVAADLNGDGHNDLAVANSGSNDVSILINKGDATFHPAADYDAGDEPQCIDAADFDQDGDEDLAVSNDASYDVSVLLNNGDGTFENAAVYRIGYRAFSVFASDLDNDGAEDLAVCGYISTKSGNLSVLMNDGSGTFGDPVKYASGDNPRSIVADDLDGDGYQDLVAGVGYSGYISVSRNRGNGMFQAAVCYEIPNGPEAVFAADLNGDALRDLAVIDYCCVYTLLNRGDSTFGEPVGYPVGEDPLALVAADFDGDGDNDLAVANSGTDDVSILLNDGDAGFTASAAYPAGDYPLAIIAADFDGSGSSDLAVANSQSGDVSILLSNGDGTFQAAVDYGAGLGARSMSVFDLDSDGDSDLFVVCTYFWTEIYFLINQGDGTFDSVLGGTQEFSFLAVAAADLDGDGREDLAVTSYAMNRDRLSIRLNNGDGTFREAGVYALADTPISICATDADGDGDYDLAAVNKGSSEISISLNNGDATFQEAVFYETGYLPTCIFPADLDGDLDDDLAVANSYSNDVSVHLNIAADDRTPLSLALRIFQNPYLTRYIDIYLIGSRKLGAGSIEVEAGSEVLAVHPVDEEHNVWRADYKIDGDGGIIEVSGCAGDPVGNDTCVTASFSHSLVHKGLGGRVYSPDGKFSVTLGPGVLTGNSDIVVIPLETSGIEPASMSEPDGRSSFTVPGLEGVPPAGYCVGPMGILRGEAFVEFEYGASETGPGGISDQVYIEQAGVGPLDSYLDVENGKVGARITEFGDFRLRLGRAAGSRVVDPAYLHLYPCYPNPFIAETNIRLEVRARQDVRVTVYDVAGRAVARLWDGPVYPGIQEIAWDGTRSGGSAAGGLYFIRVETEHGTCSGKVLRLR